MNRFSVCGPSNLYGLAEIMQLAFAGDNLSQLHAELLRRIADDESDAAALLDMSIVLQLRALPEAALELQWQALHTRQHYRLASNPPNPRLRVLAIMGPGAVMANTPLEFLVQQCDVALDLLYVGTGIPPVYDIPQHDVAFVSVCESDENQGLLSQLHHILQYWPRPYINAPRRIAELSRDRVAQRLRNLSGVAVCDTHRASPSELARRAAQMAQGGTCPVIVRPVDSHAGHGLAKIENSEAMIEYLAAHTNACSADDTAEAEFYLAPFVDYRSEDGLYRKYRVAMIAGRAYPSHMALSPRWMVHYLNADMLDSAENRAAEANFMDSFDWEFGARHRRALASIDARLGLDYYSLDCGELPDGRLLVFEIDSGAVVHAMDPVDIFPYKKTHMQKLFSAFRGLLYTRAAEGGKVRTRAA